VRHTPRDDLEEIVDGLRGEAEATEEDGRPAAERDKILDAIEAIRQARARVDAHGETL
jgi:hypothetical protein